jgi:DNA-binding winged helix-turn-helix (wHTH) protein/Tol biopolymer transport system component
MTGSVDTGRGYEFGPFRLDVVRRRLWRDGQLVPLPPRSFDTLLALVEHPGRLIEKDELMRLVWRDTFVVEDNLIQHISTLRKVLGEHSDDPAYILTVPRRGYRFLASVREIADAHVEAAPVALVEPPHDTAAEPTPVGEDSIQADATASRRHTRARPWGAVAGLVVVAAAVGLTIAVSRRPASVRRPMRFVVNPPLDVTLLSGGVLSPDGRRIVYVAGDSSGQSMLMLRALDETEATPVPGSSGASTPFWSPDSQSIGFFSDHALMKVGISGEPAQIVVESFPTRGGGRGGGTWSREGVIVYAPTVVTELYSVSANGGTPHAVTSLAASGGRETAHQWPQFLPDGRHFLYAALGRRPEDTGVYVGSLDSSERTFLFRPAVRTVFAAPGYLLFARDGALVAQRFDPERLRLDGTPRPLASVSNQSDVTISAAGAETLIYSGVSNRTRELAWYDRTGRLLEKVGLSEAVASPELSPDRARVAVEHHGEIWLVELSRRTVSRFMLGPDVITSPVWSPDGTRIAVGSRRAIYARAVADAGREQLLAGELPAQPVLYDWSSDGRFILYTTRIPATQWDLWILPVGEGRPPIPFLQTPFTEYQAQISPDGHWIAYVSDESGALDVYVDAFPERGRKTRVSMYGGMFPRWRGDGRELFYLTTGKKLMAVDVRLGPTVDVAEPHMLFQTRITGVSRNHYNVTRDGQRFLINSPSTDIAMSPITVVVNWTALLTQ